MKTIYFDHAATTAVAPEVKEAMEPYFCENYGNASSLYELGYKSKEAINIARVNVAKAINTKPNEIYFTSCGSESDNLAIKGVARAHRQNRNHIITSRIEHPAVLNTCRQLEKEGFKVTYLDVDKNGFIDLEELKNSMKTIQTLEEIKNYIRMLLKKIIGVRDTISGRRYSDIIEIAKDQIRKTYMSDEISLNTIAAEVGMSPSYFSSIFSKEMGKTFVEYLTEIRMDRAKELLMCSSMKTSEIGYEVGYKDPHYFSYIFKKTQNCTPKEFRARGKE